MRKSRAARLRKEDQEKKSNVKKNRETMKKKFIAAIAMFLVASIVQPVTNVGAEAAESHPADVTSSSESMEDVSSSIQASSSDSPSSTSSSADSSSTGSEENASGEISGDIGSAPESSAGTEGDLSEMSEGTGEDPSPSSDSSTVTSAAVNYISGSEVISVQSPSLNSAMGTEVPSGVNAVNQSQSTNANPSQTQVLAASDSPQASQSQGVDATNLQSQMLAGGQLTETQQAHVSVLQNQNTSAIGMSAIEQTTAAQVSTLEHQSVNTSMISASSNQTQAVNTASMQLQIVSTEGGAKLTQDQETDILATVQGNITQSGNVTLSQLQGVLMNGSGQAIQLQTNGTELDQYQSHYSGDLTAGKIQVQGAEIVMQQKESASTSGDVLTIVQAQSANVAMGQTMSGNPGAAISTNSMIEMVKQATNTTVNITQAVKAQSFQEVLKWVFTLDEINPDAVKEKAYHWDFDWGQVEMKTSMYTSSALDQLSATMENILSIIYRQAASDSYNWYLEDHDHDGILNGDEQRMGTNPYNASTNLDGIPDNIKVQLLQIIPRMDPASVDLFRRLLFQSLPVELQNTLHIPEYLNGVIVNPTDEAAVKKSIMENLEAIRNRDAKEYMNYISQRSEVFNETQQSIADIFKTFKLDVQLNNIQILSASDSEIKVKVIQTTNKVSGPEFQNNRTEIIHTLVREEGMYKILQSEIVNMVKTAE